MQQPIIGMEGQAMKSGGKKRWLFKKVIVQSGGFIDEDKKS
jgi:hypothetical protein